MFKFDFRETFPCTGREIIERSMYDFSEYPKFAPNVTRADVLKREMLPDGREHIELRVYAQGWLPPIARTMFKQEDMNWKELYWVDLEKMTCDWQVETPIFTKYIDCKGTSYATNKPGGGSEIVVTGTMTIGVPPIPGVPEALVRSIIGVVEPFIGKLVIVNLQKYFRAIKDCIVKEKRAVESRK